MVENIIIGTVLSVALAIVVLYFVFVLGKKIILLLINSFLGLVALVLLNFLPFVDLEINLFSVLIAALGGLPGVILLLLLSALGIAF